MKNTDNILKMKWIQLKKGSDDIYRLNTNDDSPIASKSLVSSCFSQLAFDDTEERLITTDTRGYVYQFEFRGFADVTYKKFEKFAALTCLAFNPLDKSEIILALTTNDIAICKTDSEHSLTTTGQLSSHRFPVLHITFYKDYCLTASSKEAIIWDFSSCVKTNQLRLGISSATVKKAAFSNCGHVAVLYSSDYLQIWSYEGLKTEKRVALRDFGLRCVKDFVFSRDARAIVICAAKGGIRVLDTNCFELVASFEPPESRSIPKRICMIPNPFGVATTLAVHYADGSLKFFDLSGGSFVKAKQDSWHGVRNFAVSAQGRWIAYVEVDGSLGIRHVDGLFTDKEETVKKKKKGATKNYTKAHRTHDHLRSIKENIEEELRLCRLLTILKEFGEYPQKHRTIIWSTIMELPMNREACTGLTEKISQNALIRDMLGRYPLQDQSKSSLLATTVDRLVRWCPFLGQCQYLPALIFPFITVFQKNRLLALEASITLLTNFCQMWFEYYPLPPLNVLGIMENILLEADPALLTYFCEHGITSTDYAWPLLQSTLSEVLTANEWLILWDHILSYRRPSFLLLCAISYSICCRESIISLLKSPDEFRRFYSTPGNLSVKRLLKVARSLDENTPERIHPNRYLRSNFIILPNEGPYPPFLMNEYPKFLIEEESAIVQLGALKEEEKILQEHHRKAMKIADAKRLRDEMENFVEDVHQNRMRELRKCYSEQLRITRFNVENTRDEIRRYASTFGEKTSRSIENNDVLGRRTRSTPQIGRNTRIHSNNCNELSKQVQDLESQVKRFLGALGSRSSSNAL